MLELRELRPEDALNNHQLIARVLAGDARAERQLYDAHVDRVYRLVFRLTGDSLMAQEYVQETFVKVFAHLAEFKARSALSTWIYSITVSVVRNGWRKVAQLRQRETELSEAATARFAGTDTDVLLKRRLHEAIDRLPEEMVIVFIMQTIEGYKYREIAEILDMPVGTAKSCVSRARGLLQSLLSDHHREHSKEGLQ